MTWAIWLSFAAISAVNIVTPGPANLNTLRRAVQLGGRRVLPTILGNALGLALGGALCAAGIASFVLGSALLWPLFRGVGVVYLAWLGLRLMSRSETLLLDEAGAAAVSGATLFREAVLLAATNPKALLFYMALFPQVLEEGRGVAGQAGLLILTYCALSILSLGSYAALAGLLRKRIMTQARYDGFRRVSGVVLIGFALAMWLEP